MRHRRLRPVIQWIERAGSGVWNDEEKETGKSSSGGGDPDAPCIVPDHRCERGRAERTVVCDCKAGRFSAGNRSDFAQEKRIRVPDGVRERGTISTYCAATESRKAEAFPYRSKKYRNRKTPFSCGQNSSDLPQRRSRKAPSPALRRAENESGGGNLSRI